MIERPPKNFTNKRWSLYIAQNDQLAYVLDGDNIIHMLGYVVNYFEDDAEPINSWSLYLNFNATGESFQLKPSHFTDKEGRAYPSQELLSKIKSIDLNYKRAPRSELEFIDIEDNEELRVSDFENIHHLSEDEFKDKMRERFAKKWQKIKEGNTEDTKKLSLMLWIMCLVSNPSFNGSQVI